MAVYTRLCFFVFLLCFFCGAISQESRGPARGPPCVTPYNLAGECKSLTDCFSLISVLVRYYSEPSAIDYMKSSKCGTKVNEPDVCCPADQSFQFMPTPVVTDIAQRVGGIEPSTNLFPDTTVCGQGQNQGNVNTFPWIASIEYTKPNGKGFHCMGVLINSRYVLTVAHCVSGDNKPKNWQLTGVRLGEWKSNFNNANILDVPVESSLVHNRYNPDDRRQYNDIALLRLATPVEFSSRILPICLPIFNERLANASMAGQDLYLGGAVSNRNKPNERLEDSIRVREVSHFNCTGVYQQAGFELSVGQVCAGRNTKDGSCSGNAGSPLMMYQNVGGRNSWYVYGIDSFGPADCNRADWPEIYTKIASYGSWITSNVRA